MDEAYFNDVCVGAVVTRKEAIDAPPVPKTSKALAQHELLLQTLNQKLELV